MTKLKATIFSLTVSAIATLTPTVLFAIPSYPSLPLHLTLTNTLAVSKEKAIAVTVEALARVKEELAIAIRLVKIEQHEDINPNRNLQNFQTEPFKWRLIYRGRRVMRLIMGGPITHGGISYAGGVSFVCITRNARISEVFTTETIRGVDSFMGLSNIAEHEVGHALGAEHDDSGLNVMWSSSTEWGYLYRLPFSEQSKKEIRRCMRGMRK